MMKPDFTRLMQKYFTKNSYTVGQFELIYGTIAKLPDHTVENIVKKIVSEGTKATVSDFKARCKAYDCIPLVTRRSLNPHEFSYKCGECFDSGVVFVKTDRTDMKTIAMSCNCNGRESELNLWGLPKYSADFCIVRHPYLKIMDEGDWPKWGSVYAKHMKKSKVVWDSEA